MRIFLSLKLIGVSTLLVFSGTSHASSTVVGSLDGKFEVATSGAATYSVPLTVPPGVAGVNPKIGLTYNSQNGNSALGQGWSLNAATSISRCPASKLSDGYIAGVSVDSNDRLCLAGAKLKVVEGVYGQQGARYKTEIDQYSIVTQVGGNLDSSNVWFEVKTKHGRILEYGNTNASSTSVFKLINHPNKIFRWHISKISDRSSNYMVFNYQKSPSSENLLDEIEYTGNMNAGQVPTNFVKFIYEDRQDTTTKYVAGTKLTLDKRLVKVQTFVGSSLARSYELSYSYADVTLKTTILKELKECSSAASPALVCLKPTKFNWIYKNQNDPAFVNSAQATNIKTWSNTSIRNIAADFTGDGITDFLVWHAPYNNYRYNLYKGGATGFSAAAVTPIKSWDNPKLPNQLSGDFNGDGFQDVLIWHEPFKNYRYNIYYNDKNGNFLDAVPTDIETWDNSAIRNFVMDVNSDGRDDVVVWHAPFNNNRFNIYFATDSGFSAAVATDLKAWQNSKVEGRIVGDYNGDGLPDILSWHAPFNNYRYNLYLNNGSGGFKAAIATDIETHDNTHIRNLAADLNGDGLTDVMVWHAPFNNNRFNIYFSNGKGFEPAVSTTVSGYGHYGYTDHILGDYNGDGLPDMMTFHKPLNNSRYNIHFNNGQGFGPAVPTAISAWSNHEVRNASGDFNGDGKTDLLVWHRPFSNYRFNLWTGKKTSSPRVSAITNGYQQKLEIDYGVLSNPLDGVYTKYIGNNRPSYPDIGYCVAVPVVKEYRVGTGIDQTLVPQRLHYYEGRVNSQGRGVLGFSRIDSTNGLNGAKETKQFSQTFPQIGSLVTKTEYSASGNRVSHTEHTKDHIKVGNSEDSTHYRVWTNSVKTTKYKNTLPNEAVKTRHITLEQDSYGNVTLKRELNYQGDNEQVVEPFLRQTVSTYQNNGSPNSWLIGLKQSEAILSVSPSGFQTRSSTSAYDGLGRLLKATSNSHSNLALETEYSYDDFGNVTQISLKDKDGVSRTNTFEFSSDGRFKLKSTNALGQFETNTLDNLTGKVTSATGINTLTTHWTYDEFGRVEEERRPDGSWTKKQLVGCGSNCTPKYAYSVVVTESTGARIETSYDSLARVTHSKRKHFNGGWLNRYVEYDILGRQVRVSKEALAGDPVYWTEKTYDELGRVIEVESPESELSGDKVLVKAEYDGLQTRQIDALGRVTKKTVNAIGQTTKVEDPLGGQNIYEYSAFGDLIKLTDANGNKIQAFFNDVGNKVAVEDPNSGRTEYTYNAFGDILTQKDANQNTFEFEYDVLGRMTQSVSPDGVKTWQYDTRYKGKISTATGPKPDISVDHFYDPFGRVLRKRTTIGAETFDVINTFDGNSRISGVSYPNGYSVHYAYKDNFLHKVEDVTGKALWEALEVDALQNVSRFKFGNNVESFRLHDQARGHVYDVSTNAPNGTPLQSLSYQWDKTGNLLSREDTSSTQMNEVFEYDQLNRLTLSRLNGAINLRLTYDRVGNILYKSDVGHYSYGDKPNAVKVTTGTRNGSYDYDAMGNLVLDSSRVLTWGANGKPSTITKGTPLSTSGLGVSRFDYGPYDRRYRHQRIASYPGANSQTTTTLYVDDLYEKITHTTGVIEHRSFVRAGGQVVAIHSEKNSVEKLSYLLRDHLGSVDTILDEAATVIDKLSYDAFGKRRLINWRADSSDSLLNRDLADESRGFTGHEHLDHVALIHMNGRVYDPIIGRFISADPHIQYPESTQGLNRYTYVNNNPLSYTDPSGFFLRKLFKFLEKIDPIFKFTTKLLAKHKWARVVGQVVTSVLSAYFGPWISAVYQSHVTYAMGGSDSDIFRAGATSLALSYGVQAVSEYISPANAGAANGAKNATSASASNAAKDGLETSLKLNNVGASYAYKGISVGIGYNPRDNSWSLKISYGPVSASYKNDGESSSWSASAKLPSVSGYKPVLSYESAGRVVGVSAVNGSSNKIYSVSGKYSIDTKDFNGNVTFPTQKTKLDWGDSGVKGKTLLYFKALNFTSVNSISFSFRRDGDHSFSMNTPKLGLNAEAGYRIPPISIFGYEVFEGKEDYDERSVDFN